MVTDGDLSTLTDEQCKITPRIPGAVLNELACLSTVIVLYQKYTNYDCNVPGIMFSEVKRRIHYLPFFGMATTAITSFFGRGCIYINVNFQNTELKEWEFLLILLLQTLQLVNLENRNLEYLKFPVLVANMNSVVLI